MLTYDTYVSTMATMTVISGFQAVDAFPKSVHCEPMLALERLRHLLNYDPETGILRWRARPSRRSAKVVIGNEAGTLHRPSGYRVVSIDYNSYKAHRLAWFHFYGAWPSRVDHINGRPSDNRIANLRLATPSQNGANSRQRRENPRRLKGVVYHKQSGLWRSEIMKNYKRFYLGYYRTELDAHHAYINAAKQMYGEFHNPGYDNQPGEPPCH